MKTFLKSCAVVLAAGLMVMGCEKSKSDEAKKDMGNAADKMKSASGDMMNAGTEAGSALAKGMETQLEGYKDKISSLTTGASALNNADLSGMVKGVSDKYSEVQAKISAAMKGDKGAMESLKTDGAKWMGELKSLYEKAMAKMTELKASTGH